MVRCTKVTGYKISLSTIHKHHSDANGQEFNTNFATLMCQTSSQVRSVLINTFE